MKCRVLAPVVIAVIAGSCAVEPNVIIEPSKTCASSVQLTPSPVPMLRKGQSVAVSAVGVCTSSQKFLWSTSNPDVATVAPQPTAAVVAAMNPGTTIIRATLAADTTVNNTVIVTVADTLPAPPANDPNLCPQTYEFGNYGCARVVVKLDAPPQPWPDRYVFDTQMRPIRNDTGAEGSGPSEVVPPATIQLEMYRWFPDKNGVDTATVWIKSHFIELPYQYPTGVPLPIFAADSTQHLVTFAPVGKQPPTDTVHLVLRKP